MGNPRLRVGDYYPRDPYAGITNPANGILARIPGDYVTDAKVSLAPPTAAGPSHAEVVIEAGDAGTVRVFFERRQARHHKSSYYFWCAYRAEPVTPETAGADADHA